jgi:Glycosyltransferase 61
LAGARRRTTWHEGAGAGEFGLDLWPFWAFPVGAPPNLLVTHSTFHVITLAPTLIRLGDWLGRRPRVAAVARKIAPGLDRFGGNPRLEDVAEKSWVLSPAEATVIPPAFYDEDDLARVTGVDADSSREIEWRRIRGGAREYPASVAYQLRDAVLSKGHVILPQLVYPVTTDPLPLWGRYLETEHEPSLLTATFNGSRYFGHWMMDELTRMLAAPRVGQPVAPPRPLSSHQQQYLKLLDLGPPERSDVLFRQLTILDERNQGKYRRERYVVLRERVRRGRRVVPCEGVMLLRKQTGAARILVNEEDVAERLAERGFRVMCPTEHTVEEILDTCMGAKVVLGVEGSQMTHALFAMQDRGSLVVLQPPNRFNNILKAYCDGLGLRYAFTVGHQRKEGFFVEPEKVMRLLDRLSGA